MKKIHILLPIAAAVISLTACNPSTEKSSATAKSGLETPCNYTYNSESTVVEWTAFKFTEKAPVKGTFNEIKVEALPSAESQKELLESLQFSLSTASVETQNEERNGKIAKLFFGTIQTDAITGKMKKIGEKGTATVEITLNKIARDVPGKYTLEDGVFTFSSTIDVVDWNATKGINLLNEVCKDLHTGSDGKSKLWSQVDIYFSTKLESDCN